MSEKLFNPDYLKHLCVEHGLSPSKKYGQNYLINPEVIDTMIEASGAGDSDMIVEVGPGFGALTFALCDRVKKVIAFEIEKKLQKYWTDRAPKNLEIIWGNILRINSDENKSDSLFSRASAKGWSCGTITRSPELFSSEYKVIANLPYQITSNVIRKFLESAHPPESMTIMVQKEVAERICAEPGQMSLLALSVRLYGDPTTIAVVNRNNFWPEPGVDSAILRIDTRPDRYDPAAIERVFRLAHLGFANRRKLLAKNLSSIAKKPELEQVFTKIGLAPTARAQELSVEQWLLLTEMIFGK